MTKILALFCAAAAALSAASNVYEFTMNSIDGKAVPLATFKGKVTLLVNVASRCGYTPQYTALEAVYEKYKDRGFAIAGFPANNFGEQEPGTDEEIGAFCRSKYGVTFPMFSKISVRGGGKAPLYRYLTEQTGNEIQWNFTKFLVGRDGTSILRFEPDVDPQSKKLVSAVEDMLKR